MITTDLKTCPSTRVKAQISPGLNKVLITFLNVHVVIYREEYTEINTAGFPGPNWANLLNSLSFAYSSADKVLAGTRLWPRLVVGLPEAISKRTVT